MHYNAEPATANRRILDVFEWNILDDIASPVPIFDGHNDVLLRLYRRGGTDVSRAFLEGEAKGQLDSSHGASGGFVGGLFAIFVPSSDGQNGPNDETASQRVSSGALSAPAVELAPAQRAVLSMVSLLLRIERESKGRVRICRNVTDIQQALKDDVLAPVLHIEGAEAIDPNFELLDEITQSSNRVFSNQSLCCRETEFSGQRQRGRNGFEG
jgi:membrane dipeptidase